MRGYSMPKDEYSDSSNDDLLTFISDFLVSEEGVEGKFRASPIDADGSRRSFLRILYGDGSKSVVAVKNPPLTPFSRRENAAYLKIGEHLRSIGAPVPHIHQWDLDKGFFIIEDMGDQKLQEAVLKSGDPFSLYTRVLELLLQIQTKGAKGFDTKWCCQTEYYDKDLMRRFESDYFREAFLCGYLGLDRTWAELERPFDHLAEKASRAGASFFIHRDFQSRNILVKRERIGIVDWQGGRLGPVGYDVASLLIDPYSSLSPAERKRLQEVYLEMLEDHLSEQADLFKDTYPYLAIQRNLQILGAFSFLSSQEGKPFFKEFIPPSLDSLIAHLRELGDPKLRVLEDILKGLSYPWK
jgi:aminoglycoside/choline kinase family phosphotransferase